MVAYVFDRLLTQGVRAGKIPARTRESRDWFREKAASTRITPNRLVSEAGKKEGGSALTNKILPGRMYAFFYNPKHRATLPYYDRFPLIFMVSKTEDGFYGINLHYLPPELRARLMDALYDLTNNKKFDETTKLRMSYDILKQATKFRWFKPTFKRYLTNHVNGRFVYIDSVEWDMALFLPTERFVKANKSAVWRDSRRIIRGR